MTSAIRLLADLGAASVDAVWVPVLAWTVLALVSEGALRAVRASARVGLGVRGALVALLPLLLVAPAVLARWVPSFQVPPIPALPTSTPLSTSPTIDPAIVQTAVTDAVTPPPVLDVLLGGAVVAGAVAGLVALGVLMGGLLWLRRYRRTLGAASPAAVSEARALADRLGVRDTLGVVESEPQSAPFTVGWRRPVVAVPPDLSGEALRLALAHEIAHVREAHYGWGLAERVVRAAFVWHPLLHVIGRQLALDRERAADATVLRLWPDRARRYGQLLQAIAARPAPSLALAASSSTLVHRLTAMTHPAPDRRRLAGLASALVLAVPLLLAAAAIPDALPARAATPAASATGPQPSSESAEDVTEAGVAEPDAPGAARADTLDRYIATQTVEVRNGDVTLDLGLVAGASRDLAEAIADEYSAGGEPGTLRVTYDSGMVQRSTVRRGALPPPPPPVPAPPPPPTAAPPPPPATPAPPDGRDRAEAFLRGEEAERNAHLLRRQMEALRSLAESQRPSIEDLERQVEILRAELTAVEGEIYEMRDQLGPDFLGNPIQRRPEIEARYIQLDARRDVIRDRYQRAVRELETRRIDALLEAEGG